MKISVINDTAKGLATTGGLHFGCELVMETLYDLLKTNGHEVVQKVASNETSFTINPQADLVIVNGEGSLHHNRRRELLAVAKEAPSILINTVWDSNDTTEGLEHFNYISCRESYSAKEMGMGVKVVPDLLFANKWLREQAPFIHKPEHDIGVTDNVLNQLQGGDGGFSAIQPSRSYIPELLKYKRICCGRFHSVAACAVLGIPFSAWPSNTHKIEGMMEDMGVLEHFYYLKEDALENVPVDFNGNIALYSDLAQVDITNLFSKLESFV
jgi:hypothetical protein